MQTEEMSFTSLRSTQNRPRPEFAIRAFTVEKNPVTGILEPYFPASTRRYRIIAGIITLSFMVGRSLFLLRGFIPSPADLRGDHLHHRHYHLSSSDQHSNLSRCRSSVNREKKSGERNVWISSSSYALSVASISGAVINLIVIMILGYLYEIIAYKLTQWGDERWA